MNGAGHRVRFASIEYRSTSGCGSAFLLEVAGEQHMRLAKTAR